jgi:Ca2+-binding RTX toxin-like protein
MMNSNFKRNVLLGYVVLFVLLIGFVAISTVNASKIEAATNSLVNQKLPGLIAASQLKHDFQAQTIQLYELYATNDHTAYQAHYAKNKVAILIDTANLQSLAEYNNSATSIEKLSLQQDAIAEKFVGIMANSTVDWDTAREALLAFSNGTNAIDTNLDTLVTSVTAQTQQQAETSKKHLAQLFTIGIIFVGLLFLGLSIMLYIVRTQRITQQGHFLSR